MATLAEVLTQAWKRHQAGDFFQAEQLYRQILQADRSCADAWCFLGAACDAQGKFAEAQASYRHAIQLKPDYAAAHYNLGLALEHQGSLEEAAASYRQALKLQPDNSAALINLGNVLKSRGELDQAIACYQRVLQLHPEFAEVHVNLANVLAAQDKLEEAVAHWRNALRLCADLAEVQANLANALVRMERLDEAVACCQEVLRSHPTSAEGHNGLGYALERQDKLEEAIASYQRALALQPNFAQAHNNLGNALQKQGRLDEAVACYRQALLPDPRFTEAHLNLASALQSQERFEQAAACCQQALDINPDLAAARNILGGALGGLGKPDEAVACYRRAFQLQPSNLLFLGRLVFQLQELFLWDDLGRLAQKVVETVAREAVHGSAVDVEPFQLLTLPIATTPDHQRAAAECTRRWAEQHFKSASRRDSLLTPGSPPRPQAKITIGYLSADFRRHAVGLLIPELIEKHDCERFSIVGYSLGRDDGSALSQRFAKGFDRFVDLRDASFMAAARRIQVGDVDILVDLMGYTRQARPQILALRPAPIQVSFLGYPGTMAAPFMDYILVDDFVVPPDQQPFFTEKLVHLPGCYQVNDSQRAIAAHMPSRAEFGLPQTGFVFCCFNSNYKITPEMFEVWMRLLKAVPESVLWLLENNPFAPANLRREALARGVAGERLVFLPRLPLPEHLALHRLADLFLDTWPYNAHTTASDALWAGCPLLTLAGPTFPSRVAGSLLRTLGLPELITTSLRDYEELALRLARDASLLKDLRERLQANRTTSRLFDAGQFARNLEKAYVAMWEIYTSGQQPRPFAVSPT